MKTPHKLGIIKGLPQKHSITFDENFAITFAFQK